MVIARKGFNTYLCLSLAVALLSGCQTPESLRKKQLSILRVHVETIREQSEQTERVPISREHPFLINIRKSPVLTEENIQEAKVIEVIGGFAVRIQFDRQGAMLLEQYSAASLGKHFAIFSQFSTDPDGKHHEGRWLAGPMINQRITNGVLTFTPDATREEAEQLVLGLNNVAKKLKTNKE